MIQKNPLANLPYIVEGDVVVCQSTSILGYLAGRLDLGGEDPLVTQLVDEVYDLRNEIIRLVYLFEDRCRDEQEFKQKMEKHLQVGFKKFYTKFEAIYKNSGGPYALGTSICVA